MTLLPVNLILAWGLVIRIACGEEIDFTKCFLDAEA